MESLSINNKCSEEGCEFGEHWQCTCQGKYKFCDNHFDKHMIKFKCDMNNIYKLPQAENQPVINLEFIPEPDCYYFLVNYHSGNYLNACGNNIGRESCSMEVKNKLYKTHRLWKFIREADGSYRIMNQSSGNILSSYGYGGGRSTLIMQPNIYSPFSQFRITSVPGYPNYYMIKNTFSGNCVNSTDRNTGPDSATSEPDNNPTHPHRMWSFIKDN
ncbi:hypothetical protein SteCoe_38638 [Stentor coeruleus]|uniref:Ricin B lectin domain-containing protein n=1 Tax=Stentor coeruleus TaxID=5963 RepID=A0A1R2AL89_9CILI|nr:hypothetical protein SteCoe_38638 [Stentor coeruleus]